ncbi:unnamed protein product [Dicrocoelium dendriticum]|nr:unnamed protein product [Dicrocoelium dendriticum]
MCQFGNDSESYPFIGTSNLKDEKTMKNLRMQPSYPGNKRIARCCPGYVATDLTDHKGTKTIEQGADTPFYLATLPIGVKEPINEFVSDRRIIPWSKDVEIKI